MPLIAPDLDDRTFEELVEQLRLRIPRYTPEWTDFNDSDPGMTLVQLFAWLSESMLYRMNKIPERNYIKFLQLIGQELKPAQPAVADLTFTPQAGADVQPVRQRTQVAGQASGDGGLLIFETTAGLSVTPVPLASVQIFDGAKFVIVTEKNDNTTLSFPPFGWQPQVGSALYLGFDPSELAAGQAPFPDQIRFRVFLPPEAEAGQPVSCRELAQAPAAPVNLVWEYKPKATAVRWERLEVEDGSVAFTRGGYILVEGPREIEATEEGKETETPFLWIRCRLDSGVYPGGREPVIDSIRPNTVPAENLSTVRREIVGVSEGVPDQLFELERRPVQPETLKLTVQAGGLELESWERVDDFLASGPDDAHYRLNATTGEIRFGDGQRGRIPVAGAEIVADVYRWGGGAAGNVPRGAINSPLTGLTGIKSVTNERPATGGTNEQSVEDLKEMAPHMLRRRDRAITVKDYETLAAELAGVAKATAIAAAHPDHAGVEVPGAVTVVVVPDNEDRPPRPSVELLRAVCRHLDERRPLTCEVHVKGPSYQKIQVEAVVAADSAFASDRVKREVIKALNNYLSPLGARQTPANDENDSASQSDNGRGNGDRNRGRGWSFGHDLFPTSLYNVILVVEGVTAVEHLAIQVDGRERELAEAVRVPPDGLLYGDDHDITVVPYQDL